MEKLDIVYNTISDKEILNNIRLSVVLSTDGLCSFIPSANGEGAIICFKSDSIKEKCYVIEYLLEEYNASELTVFYDNSRFSLIPRKLFLYGYEKDYVRNVFETSKQDVLFNDQIVNLEAVNIYAYSLIADLEIRQKFPGVKTNHFISCLLEHYLKKADGLYCHFLQNSFYLIDRFNGKITCNARHSYNSVDDIVYVVSNWKNTSEHENPLVFGGLLHADALLFKSLLKHLGHISLCEESIWENSISTFK